MNWLYGYVFRGIGVLFLVGVITLLFLMFNGPRHKETGTVSVPAKGDRP